MLTEQEVQAIWDEKFAILKPYFQGGVYAPKKIAHRKEDGSGAEAWEYPEFWPGYRNSREERHGLLAHIEHGYFPDELFARRAPNQTEKEEDYIRNNFRQITLPVYADFENTLLRAFNESNWSIDYTKDPNTESSNSDFEEYVTKDIPEFGSLVAYMRYILPKLKTADAMGVVTVMPGDIPVVQGEDGTMVVDPAKKLEPIPAYFPVDDVWGFKFDQWYLLLTQEKSLVTYRNREVKEGLVLLLADDQNFWRIEQYGDRIKMQFQISLWYEHGVGYAPVQHLMGQPSIYDGSMRWQSPYLAAKEPLDCVLLDQSYLGLSKATGVFPYRVMLADDCDFVSADGVMCKYGKLIFIDGERQRVEECPKCKGSGLKSRLSPAGVMLVKPPDATGQEGNVNVTQAIQWTSPDVTTLEFLQKQIIDNINSARQIMHLNSEAPMQGGDYKTATQSGLDQRSTHAFIKPISDQYFDILEFMMISVGKMRYGAGFDGVTISRPTSFDIRTEEDMLADIKAAYSSEAPMPQSVIDYKVWNYLNARYQHDPKAMRAFETISGADVIFSVPFDQIKYQLSQKLIEPWQVVLHFSALSAYDELFRNGKITGDMEKDIVSLQQWAKDNTPQGSSGSDAMGQLNQFIGKPAA